MRSDFDGFMTLKEGNLWYKFEGPSYYGNELCTHFISAVVWNAYHALQWYEMHTRANFLKPIIFLKSISSLLQVYALSPPS